MVQVKGIRRLLTQRLSSDLAGRVKYSTLCPSRSDSPCAASRAMPMRAGFAGNGGKGREDVGIFAFYSLCYSASGIAVKWDRGVTN